jgi:hypothetical protein
MYWWVPAENPGGRRTDPVAAQGGSGPAYRKKRQKPNIHPVIIAFAFIFISLK